MAFTVLDRIVFTLTAGNIAYSLYQHFTKAPGLKIDKLLNEARAASGTEADVLLARVSEVCRQRIARNSRDAHALHQWGVALWWRAAKATGAEADRLFEQADQKFSAAQYIAPNDAACCSDRVGALRYRAKVSPGEKARQLLRQTCELCRKRVGTVSNGPYDGRTFYAWGTALWMLAMSENGTEARRLYQEADEKFTRGRTLAPEDAGIYVEQANALLHRAVLYSGDQRREIVERARQQCQQLASAGSGGAYVLVLWCSALCGLGSMAKGAEPEAFFAEAEKKARRALEIAADTPYAAAAVVRAMTCRALLARGEARGRLLLDVCEEATRFDQAGPRDAELLRLWGVALDWRAAAANRADAVRLFAEAEEKYSLALSAKPADESISTYLGASLSYHSKLLGSEAGRPLVLRSGELLDTVLKASPGNCEALSRWADLLCWRVRFMDRDDATRMALDGVRRFEAAAEGGANPDSILRGWGIVLWTLAKLEEGEESARRLLEAKAKFLESETRVPRSAAYDLAYVCSHMGGTEECRHWLETSGEPGLAVSRNWLEADPEFAAVRECEWFQRILAGQP